MANLMKSANGLLFHDDFSEQTLMWTLSPSDVTNVLEFGEKGLQIKHSDKYVMYTIVEPELEEYSCIVTLDHVPFNFDDIAGVVVFANNQEYAECQSYMAIESSEPGHAINYYDTILNMVKATMEDVVQYSMNDDEPSIIDFSEAEDEIHSAPGYSGSTSTGPFVDVMYKYIKFHKMKSTYVFYASVDGYDWIEVGNIAFPGGAIIGFFVYASDNQELLDNSHCYFNDFALYNSKYLTIRGIGKEYDMEMFDGDGHVIFRTDNTHYQQMVSRVLKLTLVNTTTLPTPIKNAHLRMYSKTDYTNTIKEFDLGDIYGGDEFTLSRNIGIYIDNHKIEADEVYDLGMFYSGSYFIKMVVRNDDDDIAANVKLKVIRYSEYYGGEEEVSLALYDEDQATSSMSYSKELVIDEIKPTEGKTIVVKLMDRPVQDFYMTANSYRFKIVIE